MAKSSKDDVQSRQDILVEIVRKGNYVTKSAILEDLNDILGKKEISLPTLSRDLDALRIAKPKGSNYYACTLDLKEEFDRNSTIAAILKNTTSDSSRDVDFLSIQVTEDLADYIGKKLLDLYPDLLMDYIPTKKHVILMVRPVQKSLAKDKLYDLLKKGKKG